MCKPGRPSTKKMNLAAYALFFLLAIESNNAETSCKTSGCQTGSVSEDFKGLIVALNSHTADLYMVPTDPDGKPSPDETQQLKTGKRVSGIEVDYRLQQAYMYSQDSRLIYKVQNCPIGLSKPDDWTYLHRGISPGNVKLAVDWISHNIYWTDPYFRWIMVQSLLSNDQSMYHVIINDNLEAPNALALDPMEGLLFWSDRGRDRGDRKIEVSSLSGRNRKTLIDKDLIGPTSLAADHEARRIYFADKLSSKISSATYEGKDEKIFFKKDLGFFADIAVYREYLYMTDIYKSKLFIINKMTGKKTSKIKGNYSEAVTVFRPEAQPISTTDLCVGYGCEHICVTEKDGATCLCKDGYTLNQDMKTCSFSTKPFQRGVIYSDESNICIMDIRSLADFVFDSKCVLNTTGTKYMALDTDQKNIFLANDTAIYWASVDNFELHRLTEPSGIISGMAWDGYKRNLYWTEENTGKIWRVSAESGDTTVFLDGLNKPRDIMILPHERRVYWISGTTGSAIEASNINGSNSQIIRGNLEYLRSLGNDPVKKRIFFIDNGVPKSCNLNCSGQIETYGWLKTSEQYEPDNLEIYRGYMLMTARYDQNTKLMSIPTDGWQDKASVVLPRNIAAIKVFDDTLPKKEKVLE